MLLPFFWHAKSNPAEEAPPPSSHVSIRWAGWRLRFLMGVAGAGASCPKATGRGDEGAGPSEAPPDDIIHEMGGAWAVTDSEVGPEAGGCHLLPFSDVIAQATPTSSSQRAAAMMDLGTGSDHTGGACRWGMRGGAWVGVALSTPASELTSKVSKVP